MQLIPYFELIVGPLSRSSLQQGDRVARALLAVFMEALEESFENGQPIDQELQIAAAKYAMSNKISGTLESFVNFTAQLLPIERERLSNLLDRNPNPKIPDIQKALPEERHPALTKLSNLSHGYDGNDIHFPRYLELALRVQTFLNPRSETRMRFPELEPLMPDYNRSARRWHRELQHRSQSLRAEASDLSSRSEMRSIEGKSNLEAPIGTALSQFWESVAVNIETAAQGKDSQAVLDYLFPVGVSDPFGEGVQRLANQMKVPAEMQRQLAYETLNRIRGLFAGALILGGSASLRVSTGPAIEVSPALRELFSQDEATMNQTLNEVYTRWYQTKFNRLPDQPLVNPKSRSAIILSANMLGSNQTQIQNLFAQLTEGSKTTGVLYDVATPTESQALALMRLYKVLIPVAHRMGSKVMQTRLGQSFQQETRWFLAKGEPTILELSDRAQNEGLQYDDLGLDLEVAYKIGNLVLDSAELLKKVEDDPSGIRILSRTAVGAILSFLDELVTNYQGNVTAQRAA